MTADHAPEGLSAEERDDIAGACDAMFDFGDTWIRFLRNGNEDVLLPVVERILTTHTAALRAECDALRERVETLADEWEAEGASLVMNAYGARDVHEGSAMQSLADLLRAVLHPDPSKEKK